MSQIALDDMESRLETFKASIEPGQWRNFEFVFSQSKNLAKKDLPLAFRLAQRAKNLNPENPDIVKHIELLRKQLRESSPQFMKSSSYEHKLKRISDKASSKVGKQLVKVKNVGRAKPYFMFVLIPFFLFAVYQVILASPRYESDAKLIIKQPDSSATLDTSMALLSGLGMSSNGNDNELIKAYIYSSDMLTYLESKLPLVTHYSDKSIDFISRMDSDASIERRLDYYLNHVTVDIDDISGVLTLLVQGYSPEFANELSLAIVQRSEWFINEINHKLAEAQLGFVRQEHQRIEAKLHDAKLALLGFQSRHNLLDPEAEGMALQQIAYGFESQIAAKRSEIGALRSTMSNNAPQVLRAQAELDSLQQQLANERNRLTEQKGNLSLPEDEKDMSVSEILTKYTDYKINLEYALQAYTSSQISLEKSRIEAYRQIKYLMVVQSPTLPEMHKYPEVFYNLALCFVLLSMLFGIGRVIIATVEELR